LDNVRNALIEQNVAKRMSVEVAEMLAAVRSIIMSVSTSPIVNGIMRVAVRVVDDISIDLASWRDGCIALRNQTQYQHFSIRYLCRLGMKAVQLSVAHDPARLQI
jgi:hypothetical protein